MPFEYDDDMGALLDSHRKLEASLRNLFAVANCEHMGDVQRMVERACNELGWGSIREDDEGCLLFPWDDDYEEGHER